MATEAVGGKERVAFECQSDLYRLCPDCTLAPNLMVHHKQQHGLSQPINWNVYHVNDANVYHKPATQQTPSASCETPYQPLDWSFTNEPDAGSQTYRERAVGAVRKDPDALEYLVTYDRNPGH